MTVYAITDTKKRTGIAPTYLQTTLRRCVFYRSKSCLQILKTMSTSLTTSQLRHYVL